MQYDFLIDTPFYNEVIQSTYIFKKRQYEKDSVKRKQA